MAIFHIAKYLKFHFMQIVKIRTQRHPTKTVSVLALELEFTLEAWRFSFDYLVPKLKQLNHLITRNRYSQP